MTLDFRTVSILIGVLRDTERLAQTDPADLPPLQNAAGAVNLGAAAARARFVPLALERWFGEPVKAVVLSQFPPIYQKMESAQLVDRLDEFEGGTVHTTHLRLTKAGRRLARQLAGDDTGFFLKGGHREAKQEHRG